MSLVFALLLAAGQSVPVPPTDPDVEEVVVTATLGRTTMLFDKGADGRLRNCRIMVSSGSNRRDSEACQATPVCYAGTRDEVTDCVEMAVVETRAAAPLPASKPAVFAIPKLVPPKAALSPMSAGPSDDKDEDRRAEEQRVKLPPLPKAPGGGAVIVFKVGDGQQ